MSALNDTYRRSIWKMDDRYSINKDVLSGELLNKISCVQSVESAKKRTPPIPIQEVIDLIEAIEEIPDPENNTPLKFEEFLQKVEKIWGTGFKTSICILSVLTEGKYPPLDANIIKAARIISQNSNNGEIQEISTHEAKVLNGTNREKLSKVYIGKLCPLWNQELEKNDKNPEKVDNMWFLVANETKADISSS